MGSVPRFIRENPADPRNRAWVDQQIAGLEESNRKIIEARISLSGTLAANGVEISKLRAFLAEA